jgi:membrane protein DedA with SNARE-associated domain
MDQWIEDVLRFMQANRSWAGPVIFALAFAESMAFVSILVPFTAMIIGAGTLLCGGTLDPWIVIPWGIGGAAAGDAVSYWIGRYFKSSIPRVWPFKDNPEALQRGYRFFDRWGILAVFIGRFFGPLRAVVPIVAGMMNMGHVRFQLANVGSAIIWLPAIMSPGYLACTVLKDVANLSEKVFVYVFLFFTGASLIGGAAVWVRGRMKQAAARRRDAPPPPPGA